MVRAWDARLVWRAAPAMRSGLRGGAGAPGHGVTPGVLCYGVAYYAVRLTFVETPLFAGTAKGVLSDEALRAAQDALLDDPQAGAVIRGTGGARKLRVALSGGGKSGGARVVYVYVAARARVYLLLTYPKNVADSISDAGRTVLAGHVRAIKEE